MQTSELSDLNALSPNFAVQVFLGTPHSWRFESVNRSLSL